MYIQFSILEFYIVDILVMYKYYKYLSLFIRQSKKSYIMYVQCRIHLYIYIYETRVHILTVIYVTS